MRYTAQSSAVECPQQADPAIILPKEKRDDLFDLLSHISTSSDNNSSFFDGIESPSPLPQKTTPALACEKYYMKSKVFKKPKLSEVPFL